MREKIKEMVTQKNLCVLATVSGGTPHCSLMSYAVDDECREIYMATHKDTKKYKNMVKNPPVSLLIDNREEHTGANRQNSKALTISGIFQNIDNISKQKTARDSLLKRHPHLNIILDDPGAVIFCVKIISFLLLDGLTDAFFENV